MKRRRQTPERIIRKLRVKRIVADKELENVALKEIAKGRMLLLIWRGNNFIDRDRNPVLTTEGRPVHT